VRRRSVCGNLKELIFGSAFGYHTNDPTFVKVRFTTHSARATNYDHQLASDRVSDMDIFIDFSRHIICKSGSYTSVYQINGEVMHCIT
jgi:hypothetical protein